MHTRHVTTNTCLGKVLLVIFLSIAYAASHMKHFSACAQIIIHLI